MDCKTLCYKVLFCCVCSVIGWCRLVVVFAAARSTLCSHTWLAHLAHTLGSHTLLTHFAHLCKSSRWCHCSGLPAKAGEPPTSLFTRVGFRECRLLCVLGSLRYHNTFVWKMWSLKMCQHLENMQHQLSSGYIQRGYVVHAATLHPHPLGRGLLCCTQGARAASAGWHISVHRKTAMSFEIRAHLSMATSLAHQYQRFRKKNSVCQSCCVTCRLLCSGKAFCPDSWVQGTCPPCCRKHAWHQQHVLCPGSALGHQGWWGGGSA